MILYPAIDILDGSCVRLCKGNFDQKTIYGDDPLQMAQSFELKGVDWLHIVDLSGAKDAQNRQIDILRSILSSSALNIQTGGGIRTHEDIFSLLNIGVKRVILGSIAVKDRTFVKNILNEFGADSITLAVDVVNENVAVSGWSETTSISLFELIEEYFSYGLVHVLCTDIERDGTMSGPNIDLYKKIQKKFPHLLLQASGGVSSLNDLKLLNDMNIAGVVIGKALYEGAFTLSEAVEVAS